MYHVPAQVTGRDLHPFKLEPGSQINGEIGPVVSTGSKIDKIPVSGEKAVLQGRDIGLGSKRKRTKGDKCQRFFMINL